MYIVEASQGKIIILQVPQIDAFAHIAKAEKGFGIGLRFFVRGNIDAQRVVHAGGIADADQGIFCALPDHVQGKVACLRGAQAVDMRQILAVQRAAADGNAGPVEVHDQLAPGLSVIAVAAAVDQGAVRVDQHANVFPVLAPARVVFPQACIRAPQNALRALHEIGEFAFFVLLQGKQQLPQFPRCAFLVHNDQHLAVRSLAAQHAVLQRADHRFAHVPGQELLWRQKTGPCIVAGIADDDALVVAVVIPAARVLLQAADMVQNLVTFHIDMVAGQVSDLLPRFADAFAQRNIRICAGGDTAADKKHIGPDRRFDLGVGPGIDPAGFFDDAVGQQIAEFVGMPVQYGLGIAFHGSSSS